MKLHETSRFKWIYILTGIIMLSGCSNKYERDCDPAYKAEIEKRVPEMAKRRDHRCTSFDLCEAVDQGDLELVELYFKAGLLPDTKKFHENTGRNETLLMIAAKNGDRNMMELIIQYGGDLSIQEEDGYSLPIHWAAMYGHMEIVQWLEGLGENLGGDPEVLPVSAGNGHLEMVKYLLEKGIPVDCETDKHQGNRTALEMAAENGHLAIVQILVNEGADPGHHYGNALRLASREEHNDIIRYLVEHGADINLNNPKNILYAQTALMIASDRDNSEIVPYLIKNGADLELKDHEGSTALHHAADGGYDITEYLINNGADLNVQEKERDWTPLMVAIQGEKPRNVKLLLDSGADPAIKDKQGQTAINLARSLGHEDIVEILESR